MGSDYIITPAVEERLFPGSSAIGGFIFDRDDSLNMRVAGVTTLMKRMEFSRPACFSLYAFGRIGQGASGGE